MQLLLAKEKVLFQWSCGVQLQWTLSRKFIKKDEHRFRFWQRACWEGGLWNRKRLATTDLVLCLFPYLTLYASYLSIPFGQIQKGKGKNNFMLRGKQMCLSYLAGGCKVLKNLEWDGDGLWGEDQTRQCLFSFVVSGSGGRFSVQFQFYASTTQVSWVVIRVPTVFWSRSSVEVTFSRITSEMSRLVGCEWLQEKECSPWQWISNLEPPKIWCY